MRSAASALLLLFATSLSAAALAQQLWFVPPDDNPRGPARAVAAPDFNQLFEKPEEWPFALSHLKGFGFNMWYILEQPEERLRRDFAFLRAHGIKPVVTLHAVYTEGCGKGVEGLNQLQRLPGDAARRLKRLGLDATWFGLDGPLGFGHSYHGPNACKYSVREVARRLAATVADVRSSYPEAKFVDWEGDMTGMPLEQWLPELNEWLAAYRTETGTELDALGMDLNWRKPWREPAARTAEVLHDHGALAGIILDAAGGPTVTDESWMAEAERNTRDVVAAKLPLDFAVVASWMKHPKRLLPESDPLTLTDLLDFYLRLPEVKP